MLGIEHPEIHEQVWFYLQTLALVEGAGVNVLDFGILVKNELLGSFSAVDGSVIPQGRESLVVIRVEMCEKVDEGSLGEGFTEIEVVYDDVGVRDNPGHERMIFYK